MDNFFRKLYYCIRNSRLFFPYTRKVLFKPKNGGYDWETKHNLYEIEVVNYIKQVLKEGDTFIDVGANVGYYESITSSIVGKTGHIYAFEPIGGLPMFFNDNVKYITAACGSDSKKGVLTIAGDTGDGSSLVKEFLEYNNALVPDPYILADKERMKAFPQQIEVPIIRLDDYIKQNGIKNIKLIKIDTECYELEVLRGLSGYFETGERPIIICEIQPIETYKKVLGMDIQELIDYMRNYGYEAYNIFLPDQKIDLNYPIHVGNVIFKAK